MDDDDRWVEEFGVEPDDDEVAALRLGGCARADVCSSFRRLRSGCEQGGEQRGGEQNRYASQQAYPPPYRLFCR